MTWMIRTVLFWTLLLCACSPGVSSPEAVSPTLAADPGSSAPTPTVDVLPRTTSEALPPPKRIATLATPHIDQGPDGALTVPPSSSQGCAYQWANQQLPELSDQLLAMLQQVQPEAQGNAYAFGENCIREDGSATFLPMETDFNITLQAASLSDESELGDWIVKVMQVIENLPPDQLTGPRPGRVDMVFQSNGEEKRLHFSIDHYRALDAGLSSQEIYQALQSP
jgi:hypothetical protein